jgi:hypothetical protein
VAATLTADAELTATAWASFPIEKIETTPDGDLYVWGKATDGSVDSDNQIVDPDFAAKGIMEWLETGPNVRVQHQPQRDPAGVGVSMERDGDAHWVKSLVVEPVAKRLVQAGALRAYSVGIARPTIVRDSVARGGRITDGQIVEISLVDRPANKNCGIQLVKADKDGFPEFTGKVFGSSDILTKQEATEDVTLTLPADVHVGFSPKDLARIVSRKAATPDISKAPVRFDGGGSHAMMADDTGEVEKETGPETEKGKLTTDTRNALPESAFAIPGERAYPIHDKNHARNALARVAQHGTPEEKAKVRAAVARRYPGIGKKDAKKAAKAAASVAEASLPKKDKAACMSCGAKQNTEHEFCSECGKPMNAAMPVEKNHEFMCLKCGDDLDKGEKFCPKCGTENPGYNPMADLKIPANKAATTTEGSRVADQPDGTEAVAPAEATETVVKGKIPHDPDAEKCGCKACMGPDMKKAKKPKKGKMPFGGNQAKPFGSDSDDADAKKGGDAPLTAVKRKKVKKPEGGPKDTTVDGMKTPPPPKMDKGKKKKKGKKLAGPVTPMPGSVAKSGFGHTASPGDGVVGHGNMETVPAHREPDGLAVAGMEHSMGLPTDSRGDAGGDPAMNAMKFDADPAGTTLMRLKSLGVEQDTGYVHDLVCPAFDWDSVSKAYPTGYTDMSADTWQQKALTAAASAPLDEAKAASQLGQAVYTIKSAAMSDLIDVKEDMFKAFKDANPGPGTFPTPGDMHAHRFNRPNITTGRAAYSHQYQGPNTSPNVHDHDMAASQFGRGFMQDGRADDSPANKAGTTGAPYPQTTGTPVNLDYSSVHKSNIMQAFKAMHDHFDRVFPGVCPMNGASASPAAHTLASPQAHKTGDTEVVTKKVSSDGMTRKARRKLEKKLTRKVMKGKMPLDQARIRMGKKPKNSPEPLKPQKSAQPDLTKSEDVMTLQAVPSLTQKDVAKAVAAALRKANRKSDKRVAALTKTVNALADQPDPAAQPFKGMALNHPIRKAASPAGVLEIADGAARTQAMILSEMESMARNSTDPAQREAAWHQVLKMKGLAPTP